MTGLGSARREDGAIGGIEVIPFGFLIFVVGTLIVANAWAVVDAKLAVEQAAREATRAYVEADAASASGAADAAGRSAIAGGGRDPSRLRVSGGAPVFERCAVATFTTSYAVPLVSLPFIGGWGGDGVTVVGRHQELVDPYRSGLGRAGGCDG